MKYFLGCVLGSVLCMKGNSVGCVLAALMLIVLCSKIQRFLKNVLIRCFNAAAAAAATGGDSQSIGPHDFSALPLNVTVLFHDLSNFGISSQVPEGLSNHVVSPKKAQTKWYRKLLKAWKEATPPPKTTEEAARLVIQTLKENDRQSDVERLLAFYGLPLPRALQLTDEEFDTLPVDAKDVGDGDGMTVYVSTADPQESGSIPREVLLAADRRSKALARKHYTKADALHKKIIDSGYRVIDHQNEKILARQYRIRLRGIDAPELRQPYGNEAKEELVKLVQGKCLRVLVYEEDIYGRIVADIYCDGIFVQEALLKRGCAWHYDFYDQRPEFAIWQKEAQRNRIGLWASPNPEKPWEWRRRQKNYEGRGGTKVDSWRVWAVLILVLGLLYLGYEPNTRLQTS